MLEKCELLALLEPGRCYEQGGEVRGGFGHTWDQLWEAGFLDRVRQPGGFFYEYRLTESGERMRALLLVVTR